MLIHDVVLVNTGKESEALNGMIAEAIPDENPLMLPKWGESLDGKRHRVASFVILVTANVEVRKFVVLIFKFDEIQTLPPLESFR